VVTELTVVSWNVLAAPWAAPGYYPAEMDAGLLDRVARRELVAARLAELDADLVCLQETTPVDLAAIVAGLGPGYAVHAVPNGRQLWAGWATDDLAWEPNGTAILWRSDRVADRATGALALSDDGNVATTLAARVDGVDLHVASVHLDVDHPNLRRAQLGVACADAADGAAVIAGDCNEDTIGTDLGTIAAEHGFVDALTVAGNTEPTHPLARPTDDYAPLARLDHVLVRGGTATAGRVVDADVWSVDGPGTRMIEGLRRTGSDHLAVVARIALTPS
jgi:endonuclease/exonuclease/phosphatase family metal-dependent hydrolase